MSMTTKLTPEHFETAERLDKQVTQGPFGVRKEYFDRDEPSRLARYEVFPHTGGRKRPKDGVGHWSALATCENYEPKNKKNADAIAFFLTHGPQAFRELKEARERLEWRDPAKILPELGEIVWLHTDTGTFVGGREMIDSESWLWGRCYSYWHNGQKWDGDIESDDDYKVIAWQPLPAPPTSKETSAQ